MPLKLNVGLSRKMGLPNYSSLGASCHLEVELDSQLLEYDPEGFHDRVREAFEACTHAVEDELARQNPAQALAPDSPPNANGHSGHTNGHGPCPGAAGPNRMTNERPATAAQIRALQAIADRQQRDLTAELQSRLQVDRPEHLSIVQASRLIDELNLEGNSRGRC